MYQLQHFSLLSEDSLFSAGLSIRLAPSCNLDLAAADHYVHL